MAPTMEPQKISDAIMAFALAGRFPEDPSQLPPVSGTDLQPAIESLDRAKSDLEGEIHRINEETKEDVSSWAKNTKTLQNDIIRSKTMANDIARQSEAPDVSGEAIHDAEDKAEFLNREVQYSQQLHGVLKGIQRVNNQLGEAEEALSERRLLDALRLLETSWKAMGEVGASKSCRVMRILDVRAFELKSAVYELFNQTWKSMIQTDVESGRIAIRNTTEDGTMTLSNAVVGLKTYKEVDERAEQLWHNLDASIVSPRMNFKATSLKSIVSGPEELRLEGEADRSIDSVLNDLETVIIFIANKLPADLLPIFSKLMMADLVPKLVNEWLDSGVPSSLQNMDKFQQVIQRAQQFCTTLEENGYSGFDEVRNWTDKAPMIWLGKCRDTALDTVRNRLVNGIGDPKQVEKVERHIVTVSEGRELATTGAGAAADTNDWNEDWDDGWDDAENTVQEPNDVQVPMTNDEPADSWDWGDEEQAPQDPTNVAETTKTDDFGDSWDWGDSADNDDEAEKQDAEDDGADDWGWGDEDTRGHPEPSQRKPAKPTKPAKPATAAKPAKQTQAAQPSKQKTQRPRKEQTRELVLKETYHISSMPERVLDLVFAVLEDGATLTQENGEFALVAGTAAGLFSLPTFALALFRSISPHYYSLVNGGGMFLYNDAMYIADQLSEFSTKWKEREDISSRAKTMLRLDNDIKTLRSFANRSYANEMNIQKTILNDLLGDSQSIMQQDEMESAVEGGTARVRTMAATWESILARSVWSQAIGSLADTLASRLIRDVLETPSIGQEEAYSIAKLIAAATELDDLFLPSKLSGEEPEANEVPATAQYASNWLRLKYLSEVLQSNLNEVKYLWCDSELSLYFTVEEVVELVQASFEDNPRTRETIREIRAKQPL